MRHHGAGTYLTLFKVNPTVSTRFEKWSFPPNRCSSTSAVTPAQACARPLTRDEALNSLDSTVPAGRPGNAIMDPLSRQLMATLVGTHGNLPPLFSHTTIMIAVSPHCDESASEAGSLGTEGEGQGDGTIEGNSPRLHNSSSDPSSSGAAVIHSATSELTCTANMVARCERMLSLKGCNQELGHS